ncbi:hypothetical protein CROQUDRAFT_50635 [Cronartium quercuum f. sp. fusiforme G11]|uniref:Palmitoyltransferase n=1 Tax=Cronartium quercuum f. sp. fusiforme G11 TaxID=708437 RepID=A0A9P6N9S1_9BASI|nr:hypothetical protein CROQUDRAFT_50635 [Cronartium quercuum f. sp. fusiforme G11]
MSGIRPNAVLGRIVPILMATFMALGSRLVLTEVCPFIINELGMSFVGRLYQATFLIIFTLVSALYLWIYLQPQTHSSPPARIPEAVQRKLIVYEVSDSLGTPSICDLCGGRLKPLRSRHCLDCGSCKTGFDHHCVWFSTCITASTTLKPFIQILLLAPILLFLGALPIVQIVRGQVAEVVRLTWTNGPSGDLLRTIWWTPWWGWAGGPGWRYAGGLVLGYWHYHSLRIQYEPMSDLPQPDQKYLSLSQPTLSTLILLLVAFLVFLVTLALLAITIRHTILHGRHTIDVERFRRWRPHHGKDPAGWDPRVKVWVPDRTGTGGKVVRLEPSEDVFDNGLIQNWQGLMGTQIFEWFVPWTAASPSGVRQSEGVEWHISSDWMEKLREREAFQDLTS